MWVECVILLSPMPEGFYRSGQPVSGLLKYSLKKQTQFISATLQLKGKGKCSWTESDGDDSSSSYSGKEEYVLPQNNILQGREYNVAAGVYNYPFELILPVHLPSSFKDKTGKIKYKIIAKFSKSGFLGSTKKFDLEIPVSGYLEPCLPEPIIFGLTKAPFSSMGTINVKVKMMKTLLVAGENIKLECSIINNTSLPVTSIRIELFSVTLFISKSKHKIERRKSIKGSTTECAGPGNKSIEKIPCEAPTSRDLFSIQHSKIIKREYKLKVTAVVPFPHRNSSVEIPVVISK